MTSYMLFGFDVQQTVPYPCRGAWLQKTRLRTFLPAIRLMYAFMVFSVEAVFAVEVKDLYVAEVLVASQSAGELRRGAATGLERVLVRVSGETDVNRSQAVRAALSQPENYYYQFGYAWPERAADAAGTGGWQLLRLLFDPAAVTRLLREAGLPIWGETRPQLLLWVVVEEAGERRFVADNTGGPIRDALDLAGRRRGLPLLYPLNDLQDQAAVSPALVWGGFFDRVESASIRYPADVILIARLSRRREGGWLGRWSYRLTGSWVEFESSASDPAGLMAGLADRLVDDLAPRYATSSTVARVLIGVSAVTSLQEYAAVLDYLGELSSIVSVTPRTLRGEELYLLLETEGQIEQLKEVINLGSRLLLTGETFERGTERTLYYEWLETVP